MKPREAGLGKVDAPLFDAHIFPHLGARDSSVLVPPQHGVDFGVVDLGSGLLMALSTDPLVIQPALGFERAAWLAFQIVVADVAVSGLTPRYLAVDWNLPPDIRDEDVATLTRVFGEEAKRWGMSIVTGHTARYAGCAFPMVGGATAMALGPRERLITPRGARPGDKVIVTKGPAYEAAIVLAAEAPDTLDAALGAGHAERVLAHFPKLSPIADALTAAATGGVTAMHDATECGLLGALWEVAEASGVGIRVRKDAVPTDPLVAQTCARFGIDPWAASSEGALVLTAAPERAGAVLAALRSEGIAAHLAGDIVAPAEGRVLVAAGREAPLAHPRVDPLNAAFAALRDAQRTS